MKKLLIPLLLLLSLPALGAINAITDTGETVILNSDNTWTYADGKRDAVPGKIKTNKNKFSKPKASSFLLKSKKNNAALWINPKEWAFRKGDANKATEYRLRHKEKSLYAMLITEEIKLPLETMMEAALNNARRADLNAKITKREIRVVNGMKVLYLEISASLKNMNFAYISYNFSNDSGSTQLITYTSKKLVSKYRPMLFKLLNGLVTQ